MRWRLHTVRSVSYTHLLGPYSNADPEGKAAALLDVNDMTWYDRNGSAGMDDYSDGLTLMERIVTYTVNSSNEIRLMDPEGTEISYLNYLEYDPDTSMLGEYEIGADTCILNLCDWWLDGSSDVYTVVKDNLAPYTVYGTVAVTGSRMFPSPFVAITSGYGGFSANSRLAVVSGVSSVYDGGAVRTKLEVIENFEEKELLCIDTSFWYLETGDAIIYK